MAAGAGVPAVGGLDATATTNGAGDGPTERRADAVGPYLAFVRPLASGSAVRGRAVRPEMQQSQINRAARYRKRAQETRSEAENMNDPGSRAAMLEVAETRERLADQEEAQDLRPTGHSQPRLQVP